MTFLGEVIGVDQLTFHVCELLLRFSREESKKEGMKDVLHHIFDASICLLQVKEEKVRARGHVCDDNTVFSMHNVVVLCRRSTEKFPTPIFGTNDAQSTRYPHTPDLPPA